MTFKDSTRRASAHNRRAARRFKAARQLACLAWYEGTAPVMGAR